MKIPTMLNFWKDSGLFDTILHNSCHNRNSELWLSAILICIYNKTLRPPGGSDNSNINAATVLNNLTMCLLILMQNWSDFLNFKLVQFIKILFFQMCLINLVDNPSMQCRQVVNNLFL